MNIKISYSYDKGNCWASTLLDDRLVMSCGASFEEAKARHLRKIKEFREMEKMVIPPDEYVEV